MRQYVILGQGIAGATAAEEIRKRDPDGSITALTEENLPFYWRLKLNEYISGEWDEDKLVAKNLQWYKDSRIDLKLKTRVVNADPKSKTIVTDAGEEIPYDLLLVATGAHSFVPPIQGVEKRGTFALRSVQDARDIREAAKNTEDAVLVGGGLLGLETAYALKKLGIRCRVVEFFPRLLPRQLDHEGALILQRIMEDMGLSFHLGAVTKEILGEDRVRGILLESGDTVEGGMVIISAGVRPNLEVAGFLGLDADKGVKVDDRLRTSVPEVYAAGDVVEHRGKLFGIWPAAMEQGKIAAANMCGGDETYEGTIMANTLKVVGIDLASAGDIDAENERESRVVKDRQLYKKVVFEDNTVVGCILLGDLAEFAKIKKMMDEKQDVSGIKDSILS